MGQKINPISLRLGINKISDSRWYARKDFGVRLIEDTKIRTYLKTSLRQASISRVVIERTNADMSITIYAARPGVIIGRNGEEIKALKTKLSRFTASAININILEIRKPEIDATLVAQSVAQQLEKRVSFRRAMKRVMQNAFRFGAQGIRVNCAGRLGGAEIARTEWYREGRVPLHTLRSDIDYGFAEAHTAFGVIGVKVWLYRGEVPSNDPYAHDKGIRENLAGKPKQ